MFNYILNTLLSIVSFSFMYIGIGMVKDYVCISYLENEKNKKEN